ncbi:hypothetical protein [Stella sp.]|uniref:hypothetical protein n=1 Tax=Stella sp. TaxID=2912054 RepID=UPI0035AF10A0
MPTPPPQDLAALARRLDRLERRIGRWRALAAAGLLAGAAGAIAALSGSAAAGRSGPAELELRRLTIVDGRGQARILLTTEGEDGFIGLTDAAGATRAVVQAHSGGARIVLGDGRPRLVLAADSETVLATMNGPGGTARAVLGIAAGGRETLLLARPDGAASAALP